MRQKRLTPKFFLAGSFPCPIFTENYFQQKTFNYEVEFKPVQPEAGQKGTAIQFRAEEFKRWS